MGRKIPEKKGALGKTWSERESLLHYLENAANKKEEAVCVVSLSLSIFLLASTAT